MTQYHYGIRTAWHADPSSVATIGQNFLNFLDALALLHPAMNDWRLLDMGNYKAKRLADVRANITGWVKKNVARDDEGPFPDEGYSLLARSALVYSDEGAPGSVDVSIGAGSRWLNESSFEIGDATGAVDPDLLTYPVYRGALETLVACWPCPYASAYAVDLSEDTPVPEVRSAEDLERLMAEPWEPTPPLFLRWIVYLSAPLVAGFSPPDDLICEPTPGGGLILSATRDRFDPSNFDHLQRALRLSSIMDARVPHYQIGKSGGETPARQGPY